MSYYREICARDFGGGLIPETGLAFRKLHRFKATGLGLWYEPQKAFVLIKYPLFKLVNKKRTRNMVPSRFPHKLAAVHGLKPDLSTFLRGLR